MDCYRTIPEVQKTGLNPVLEADTLEAGSPGTAIFRHPLTSISTTCHQLVREEAWTPHRLE